jgi:hypothetical protein
MRKTNTISLLALTSCFASILASASVSLAQQSPWALSRPEPGYCRFTQDGQDECGGYPSRDAGGAKGIAGFYIDPTGGDAPLYGTIRIVYTYTSCQGVQIDGQRTLGSPGSNWIGFEGGIPGGICSFSYYIRRIGGGRANQLIKFEMNYYLNR